MPDSVNTIRALFQQHGDAFDGFADQAREQLPMAKEMVEAAGSNVDQEEAMELDYVASHARPAVADFIRRSIAARADSQPLRDAFRPPLVRGG